jgi:hypothetical protein
MASRSTTRPRIPAEIQLQRIQVQQGVAPERPRPLTMGSHAIGLMTGPWLRRLRLAFCHPLTLIQAERHDRVNAGPRQGTSPTYKTG